MCTARRFPFAHHFACVARPACKTFVRRPIYPWSRLSPVVVVVVVVVNPYYKPTDPVATARPCRPRVHFSSRRGEPPLLSAVDELVAIVVDRCVRTNERPSVSVVCNALDSRKYDTELILILMVIFFLVRVRFCIP